MSLLILTVAQSQDGVGCGDVVERDSLPLDTGAVAVVEGIDVGLMLLVVVVLLHRPTDGVVFKFQSSKQVHDVEMLTVLVSSDN